jgi:glucoamylase
MNNEADTLLNWMTRQYDFAARSMLRAISATDLVKERPHLGQIIRPVPGSVLASPEIASYDPDPDYFFHWLRDSAIVIDALRVLVTERALGLDALGYFADFIQFSRGLCQLDGRAFLRHGDFRRAIDPAFLVHVRSDVELNGIVGDHALGEVRYNPDGTLDVIKWARPQNDGPALRALTLLRFCSLDALREHECYASVKAQIECDLDYTLRHWREPCFDLWEEIFGHHYYTRVVQYAALAEGSKWMDETGDLVRARSYRAQAQEISACLDSHFDPKEGVYLSCLGDGSESRNVSPMRQLDIAVTLGVIHAARSDGPHSVLDPKALATQARLEQLFAREYKINLDRGPGCAPAMGRYAGDVYYSGGAYYFSTLGAAQFYFRVAEGIGKGATIPVTRENQTLLAEMLAVPPETLAATSIEPRFRARLFGAFFDRGDMFMAMVRKHTPASGELSEQFAQTNGAQTSAKNLAWSYAAFITAFASRKAASATQRPLGPNACGARLGMT